MKPFSLTLGGTAGGTLLSVIPVLDSQEVMRTIALAAIGAMVSFIVSFLIKAYLDKEE